LINKKIISGLTTKVNDQKEIINKDKDNMNNILSKYYSINNYNLEKNIYSKSKISFDFSNVISNSLKTSSNGIKTIMEKAKK